MSVDLSKLIIRNKISIDELNGKVIAIDAFNVLYQFLSIIRQSDGTPLHDSKGNITSYLSGIFYRTIEMTEHGIKPIYVFDGIPPKLKAKTISARIERRQKAYADWQKAKTEGRLESAKSYAEQSSYVNKEMVTSAKLLMDYMGVPYINAPAEGEAEASYLCKEGLVYAAGSQDYDTLLFGSKRVIRNLTLSGKRKLPRKNIYINVSTEFVDLEESLLNLNLTRKKLIWIGIMLGTDFNVGIKGIGPKTALKIVKSVDSIEELESYIKNKYPAGFESDIREVEDLFMNPEVKKITEKEVTDMFSLKPNIDETIKFMCDIHDFGRERIEKFIRKLAKTREAPNQKGINSWM